MAIAAVIYLLWAIVPQFVTMFESMDAELPAITQMVLALSKSIQGQWYFWILGVLLLVIAFQITKRTEKGAYALDYAKLKIPVFGKLNQKARLLSLRALFHLFMPALYRFYNPW